MTYQCPACLGGAQARFAALETGSRHQCGHLIREFNSSPFSLPRRVTAEASIHAAPSHIFAKKCDANPDFSFHTSRGQRQ